MRVNQSKLGIAMGAILSLLLTMVVAEIPDAHANPRALKDIRKLNRAAMENFDLFEFDAAKDMLAKAIKLALRKKVDNDPAVAQVYLNLGIVYFSGLQNPEKARGAFDKAVAIDSSIEIDAGYRTADMAELLDEAKAAAGGDGDGGGDGGDGDGGDDVDCATVPGIAHDLVDSAEPGADRAITAHLGEAIRGEASKVVLHYRTSSMDDFADIKMELSGECKYEGVIPADKVNGSVMHYYIGVYGSGGKALARKGSSGSPNLIEISGAGDGENPLGGGGGSEEKPVVISKGGGAVHQVQKGPPSSSCLLERGPVGATSPGTPNRPAVKWAVVSRPRCCTSFQRLAIISLPR